MASIVMRTKIKIPSNKNKNKFAEYIDYMDREEAKEKETEFKDYLEYMGRESAKEKNITDEKVNLFTNNKDFIDKKDKLQIKKTFEKAQNNNSYLWQTIISFDDEFLKETGVKTNNKIDRQKLVETTRNSISKLLESEKMKNDTEWIGSIHYNTEHIHVHIAMIQNQNQRERYKLSMKSIRKAKAEVGKNLLNTNENMVSINNKLRKELSPKNTKKFDLKSKEKLDNLIKLLPKEKVKWKYNNNVLNKARPEINKYIDEYLIKNKKEFSELITLLNKQEEHYKKLYGTAGTYKKNKLDELYTRLGTDFLNELKSYEKENQPQKNKKDFNSKSQFKKSENKTEDLTKTNQIEKSPINNNEEIKIAIKNKYRKQINYMDFNITDEKINKKNKLYKNIKIKKEVNHINNTFKKLIDNNQVHIDKFKAQLEYEKLQQKIELENQPELQ